MSSIPPIHLTLRILLFSVVAATSPLALASVLVVLTSGRGRVKGAAFAIGFVTGAAVFCLLAFSLGMLTFANHQNHPTLIAVLLLAFGAALLVTAVHVRRGRTEPARARSPNPRSEAVRSRLANLRPLSALGAGAVLGVGGPKRLSITIVATATITAAGVGDAAELGLALLYVAVSTVLVWFPVLLYTSCGVRERQNGLPTAQHWIGQHKEPFTFYPSAVLGLALLIDGVFQLVG